jgi:hypothetical protein
VEQWERPESEAGTTVGRLAPSGADRWILAAAVVAPVVTAALLIPWRGRLDAADNALFLVVVIVAVASTGRRAVAALAALVSALSFDFFLTRPYYSFRITRHQDLITEILLLVVGLAVGELAARGRQHRHAAWQGHRQVTLLHSLTELAATGQDPDVVVAAAAAELADLLALRACRFATRIPTDVTARLVPSGQVKVGDEAWPTGAIGLPTRTIDLPVRSGGWLLGHFLLTPTPGRPVPHDRLLVAVAVADQVGAALASADGPAPPVDPVDPVDGNDGPHDSSVASMG